MQQTLFRSYLKGNSMRLIAIGDIHGDLDHLERLLERLSPTEEDVIVFLGDYVDRGPKIPETVSYLIEFGKRFPNTVFLMGNHEEMLLDGLETMTHLWYANGGDKTAKQYNKYGGLFQEHLPFFKSLGTKFRIEHSGTWYYFSHAGWDNYQGLGKQFDNPDKDILLWERDHLKPFGAKLAEDNWTDGVAVFGHTPMKEPAVFPYMVGIDTGAVFGNYLTAVVLGETWEFYDSKLEE
jgi:serine/threonine protein phosphatase 1